MPDPAPFASRALFVLNPWGKPTARELRITFDEAHAPSILAIYAHGELLPLAVSIDDGTVGRVLLDLLDAAVPSLS